MVFVYPQYVYILMGCSVHMLLDEFRLNIPDYLKHAGSLNHVDRMVRSFTNFSCIQTIGLKESNTEHVR